MLVPVPVETTAPGVLVKVHNPAAGKPLNTTLPVFTAQVGWVIVPIVGATIVEFTINGCWALTGPLQPPVMVYLMIQLPAATAVTNPAVSTLATVISLLLQDPVPPPRTTEL